MEEFYIDVEPERGITQTQVDEMPPEQWGMDYTPQFIIELHNGAAFITLTLQLQQGRWYDRNTKRPDEEFHLYYLGLEPDAQTPNYQSYLIESTVIQIDRAISNYMVAYMNLSVPVFCKSTLN